MSKLLKRVAELKAAGGAGLIANTAPESPEARLAQFGGRNFSFPEGPETTFAAAMESSIATSEPSAAEQSGAFNSAKLLEVKLESSVEGFRSGPKPEPGAIVRVGLMDWCVIQLASPGAHEGQAINMLHYWGWDRLHAALKKAKKRKAVALLETAADLFQAESGIDLRDIPYGLSIEAIRFWTTKLDAVGGDPDALSPRLKARAAHFKLPLNGISAVVVEYRGRIKAWDYRNHQVIHAKMAEPLPMAKPQYLNASTKRSDNGDEDDATFDVNSDFGSRIDEFLAEPEAELE